MIALHHYLSHDPSNRNYSMLVFFNGAFLIFCSRQYFTVYVRTSTFYLKFSATNRPLLF